MHELHDLRNVLVHSQFLDAQDGIVVDHISHHGKHWKVETGDNYISYNEFEQKFRRQKEIIEQLPMIVDQTSPISSFSREFIAAIDRIIKSSPNVFRYFPRPANGDK